MASFSYTCLSHNLADHDQHEEENDHLRKSDMISLYWRDPMEDMCKLPPQWISPGAAVKGSRSRQRIEGGGGSAGAVETLLGRVLGGVTARACQMGQNLAACPRAIWRSSTALLVSDTEPCFLRTRAINRTLLAIQRWPCRLTNVSKKPKWNWGLSLMYRSNQTSKNWRVGGKV